MGAGKSTFARAVIRHLAKEASSHGSPTSPLVQEYRADLGSPIYHIDLYRLKSEEELELSGISEQIDSRDALVMIEWGSMFPGYFGPYFSGALKRNAFRLSIQGRDGFRTYQLESLSKTQARS